MPMLVDGPDAWKVYAKCWPGEHKHRTLRVNPLFACLPSWRYILKADVTQLQLGQYCTPRLRLCPVHSPKVVPAHKGFVTGTESDVPVVVPQLFGLRNPAVDVTKVGILGVAQGCRSCQDDEYLSSRDTSQAAIAASPLCSASSLLQPSGWLCLHAYSCTVC